MSLGDPILRGAALLLLLGGCARPTEVELRLFPCGLAGVPVSVDLDVQGYDAAGTALTPMHASFAVALGDLGDGYATVGLRPPADIATADFTLTWHDMAGDVQVVTHAALGVPAVGGVLELGADMCVPQDSTSGTSTSTSTSSTSTGGTSTSSTSTGEGTSTSSTSTGEGTSTSTSTGATTESSTTGEPSMIGDGCDMMKEQYFCEHGGPGQLGTLLECTKNVWTAANLVDRCNLEDFCPPELGLVDPVPVGCSGEGAVAWACVCQDQFPILCIGDEAACMADKNITLCIDDGDGMPTRTKGACAVYCVDKTDPVCSPDPP